MEFVCRFLFFLELEGVRGYQFGNVRRQKDLFQILISYVAGGESAVVRILIRT